MGIYSYHVGTPLVVSTMAENVKKRPYTHRRVIDMSHPVEALDQSHVSGNTFLTLPTSTNFEVSVLVASGFKTTCGSNRPPKWWKSGITKLILVMSTNNIHLAKPCYLL